MLLTRDKAFYRSFSALFWPLVLQNVINLSVNLADNVMLGSLGPYPEASLAGATVVNNVQFILQMLIGGVTGGITVLGSQYWGTRRVEPIRKIASMAFWVAAAFTLLIFFACTFFPTGVLNLFVSGSPDTVREGVKYLGVVKYSYPVFTVTMILLAALNCVETVKIAFWISIEAFFVNIGLNLVLIPGYGSEGAAAAAILMAKTVGAGEIHKVRDYTRTLQVLFVGIGLVSGLLLYLLKFPVFSWYKLSDQTMDLANQFIYVFILATVGMAYQMPTVTGIIRGGGDTKFGMINDIVSIWFIVLPLSALAAFKFGWPPVAVVACLNSDQVFKCGAAAIRCNRYKWVRKLTRDEVA
jgi:Na+-driven multidrug efflux pump